jgi:hypothetical protein
MHRNVEFIMLVVDGSPFKSEASKIISSSRPGHLRIYAVYRVIPSCAYPPYRESAHRRRTSVIKNRKDKQILLALR